MSFRIQSIPQQVADEVRHTRVSPGYGHPVHAEIAGGTGPCRCCLRPFVPGVDRRLLFTYRPPQRNGSLTAPGPVFIHEAHCDAWAAAGFPDALRRLPLAFEARAAHGRVVALSSLEDSPAGSAAESPPESRIGTLFARDEVEWLDVRHAEAGCFIAIVEREGPRGFPRGPGSQTASS